MTGESDKYDRIRTTLEGLQAQLDALRKIDPAVADRLQDSIDQARDLLSRREAKPDEHGWLVNQLNDAVLELEASHPSLALNLGGLIDALGRMGI